MLSTTMFDNCVPWQQLDDCSMTTPFLCHVGAGEGVASYLWTDGSIFGASLSELHTSMTAFAEVVCMYVCLWALYLIERI